MYLQYLADPSQLIDPNSVRKLEGDVEKAKDPVEKLKAIAALERASASDGSAYEEAFIRDARAWADNEGIPPGAFRTMGVPEAVLAKAGFDSGRRRGRSARKARATRTGRAKSTSTQVIQSWMLSSQETFTLADVQRNAGGSPATIKKAIDELTDNGQIANLGPVSHHTGRGRAPYHYRLNT